MRLLRPILVAVMFACVTISVAQVIGVLVPRWSGAYAVGAVFVISLESFYSTRLVRRLHLSGGDWWRFRGAEWIIILVALKLLSYVDRGWDVLRAEMALWSANIDTIFTVEYIIVVLLALFAWTSSGDISRWLDDLSIPPDDSRFNPAGGLIGLQALYFIGGVILLIMAGLAVVGLQLVLRTDRPPIGGIILNVLVYFVVGLGLLSQARMEWLFTRWQAAGIEITGGIRERWGVIALTTLVVVGALAALLPTRYTLGLLAVVQAILYFLFQIGLFIWLLLHFALAALLALAVMLLFGREQPAPAAPLPPVFPELPPTVTSEGPDWWLVLRSILFWVVTVGIVVYALAQFIGARREWWTALAERLHLGWLVTWLALVWGRVRGVAQQVGEVVRQRLERRPATVGDTGRRGWLRLGRLSPRELVMYFYLSTEQRAAKGGLPRGPSQTAREYAERLRGQLPETAPDVDTLTEAFEAARYSAHPVAKEDTVRPRSSWERLRQRLRQIYPRQDSRTAETQRTQSDK